MAADLRLPVVRHHLAVLLVIIVAREVEMIELHGDAMLLGRGLDHAQPLGHDLLADAVAGDDCDAIGLLAHRADPQMGRRLSRLKWSIA